MKSKKIKPVLINIILLIIVLIAMLAISEIIIRIFFPQNLNYTQFDSTLMYRHIPNFEVNYHRQEYSNTIKFNSKGLRDYEYSYEKPKGTFRILLLGSSFSQALQVPLGKTYENILEKKLNTEFRGKYSIYEIINGAVGGYGTAQELFFLKTEGLKYKPDLILLDFSMRDISENSISPLVAVKDGKLVENIPVKASLPKRMLIFCSRYSHLCSLAQAAILENGNFFNSIFSKFKLANLPVRNIAKPEMFHRNSTPEFNAALEETFLLIKEIKKTADENSLPLAMLIIPHREQADDLKFKEFAEENNLNEKDLEYGKVQKLALKFARESSIYAFDMLPYFRQKNINNTFYFNIDGHWNQDGHGLAADLLYLYLVNNKIVA